MNKFNHSTLLLALKNAKIDVRNFNFVSSKIKFRGTKYNSGMAVCFWTDKYLMYDICMIKAMIVNESLDGLIFVRSKCKIFYNGDDRTLRTILKIWEFGLCTIFFSY